jgi:hypothetical protein
MDRSDAFLLGFIGGICCLVFLVMCIDPKLATYGQCEEACAPLPVEVSEDPKECWCVSAEAKTRVTPKTWSTP